VILKLLNFEATQKNQPNGKEYKAIYMLSFKHYIHT
jgi:hypothetical protein